MACFHWSMGRSPRSNRNSETATKSTQPLETHAGTSQPSERAVSGVGGGLPKLDGGRTESISRRSRSCPTSSSILRTRSHRYVTLVMDLDSGAILFVGEGKSAESLLPFSKRLGRRRSRIEAVAIDMPSAYISAMLLRAPDIFWTDGWNQQQNQNRSTAILRHPRFGVLRIDSLRPPPDKYALVG
jgi:Transposase